MFRAIMLLGLLGSNALLAQEQAQYPKSSFWDRISFGVRAGGLITGLEKSQTITESTTSTTPPLSTTTSTKSAGKRFTVGPTVQVNWTDRLAISFDFLYKRSGYDASIVTETQLTEDDDEDDYESWGEFERTRVDYWDIPITLRYYNKSPDEDGARIYFSGGVALRSATGIKSFNEVLDKDGLSDTNTAPVTPANTFTPGVVAGIGLQLRDDVGLKVELGARYTRWLRSIFDAGIVQTNRNQGELFIGLTF